MKIAFIIARKEIIIIINYFDSSPDDGGFTEYTVEIQKESENKDFWRGMITSVNTVIQVSIMFRKMMKENKKMGVNVEQNIKKYK